MGAFATTLANIARGPDWNQNFQTMEGIRNFQAQNALAGIYQQAIDPATGAFDQGKFNALVGQSPQAAWQAGPAMQQAGQAMAAQGQGSQQQFLAQQQRLTAMSGLATPLMERAEAGGQVTIQDLQGILNQARSSGLITAADLQQANTLMSQPGANPTDILRGWYFRNYTSLQQMAQAKGMGLPYQLTPPEALQPRTVLVPDGKGGWLAQQVPSGTLMGVPRLGGAGALPTDRGGGGGDGGGGGGNAPVAAAPSGLSKAQFLQQTAQRESGGDPTALNYVAKADPTAYARGATASGKYQIVNATWRQGAAWAGVDTNKYPTASSAPENVQDQVASALYDNLGEQPWVKSNQNWVRGPGGQYALQSVAPGTGGGVWPTAAQGPSIGPPSDTGAGAAGSTAAPPTPAGGGQAPTWKYPAPWETDLYGASAKRYSDALDLEETFSTRTTPLMNAIDLLAAHPDLKTGPGQSEWNSWMQALQAMNIPIPTAWAQPGYQAAWQDLGKYLAQWERSQPGADQTDLARLQNAAANPTTQMGHDAIVTLAARALGVERFRIAGLQYFREQHPDDPDASANVFRRETTQWMRDQDLTAYAVDHMPPAVTQEYYRALNPADQKRFDRSYKNAQRYSGVNLPIGGQGG